MNTDETSGWFFNEDVKWRAGYCFGLHYPSLTFEVGCDALDMEEFLALAGGLANALGLPGLLPDIEAQASVGGGRSVQHALRLLILTIANFQRRAGLPVYENGKVISQDGSRAIIVVPTAPDTYELVAKAMNAIVQICRNLRAGHDISDMAGLAVQILGNLEQGYGRHPTANQFMLSALRHSIPFAAMPDLVTRFGQGRLARSMRDTLTDATSNISVRLGRLKPQCAWVLREAGIPVPEFIEVRSLDEALAAANRIGFPVVVKPADLDGGVAVGADLRSFDEVRAAYDAAARKSSSIVVEQHVQGRDYRVTVYQGRAIWAVERVPGGVVGDGVSSIRQLVEMLNRDPRRQPGAQSALSPLWLDDEAVRMMAHSGFDPESIPPSGRFIRLRAAANTALGGFPVAAFERLHPDNASLAVRAAEVLGADIAGIDLLIPDISRSWLETGAHICEVNPGPDIGQNTAAHLFEPILKSLVPGNGRVPVVLVIGDDDGSVAAGLFGGTLAETGMTIGYHDANGVRVADDWMAKGPIMSYRAGRMLVLDRRVEGIAMQVAGSEIIDSGLPFPRFDILLIAGDDGANGEVLRHLLSVCDGAAVRLKGAPPVAKQLRDIAGPRWIEKSMPISQMKSWLKTELRSLAQSHAGIPEEAVAIP